MYSNQYGVRGMHSIGAATASAPNANVSPGCGLPAPRPAPPGSPGALAGQKYCRTHLGNSVLVPAGGQANLTLTPTNMVEFVARWCHITATSSGVSPVTFTQAFQITAINILGDNQLAANTPVIGSTWAAQQTFLEVYWDRVITAVNPLVITAVNLDAVLPIIVNCAVAGDGVKS